MKINGNYIRSLSSKERAKFLGCKVILERTDNDTLNDSKEVYLAIIKDYGVNVIFRTSGEFEHRGHIGAWTSYNEKEYAETWEEIPKFKFPIYKSWNIAYDDIKEIIFEKQLEFDF